MIQASFDSLGFRYTRRDPHSPAWCTEVVNGLDAAGGQGGQVTDNSSSRGLVDRGVSIQGDTKKQL